MNKKRALEVGRFMGVGAVSTAVDYILLNLLAVLLGLPVLVANSLSAPISSFVSYKLNKQIVFHDRMHGRRKTLVLYAVILGTGILVIQNSLIHVFAGPFSDTVARTVEPIFDLVGLGSLSERTISINAAKVFASIFSAVWNYVMLRRFVFVTHEEVGKN